METLPTQSTLSFTGSALPAQVGGVGIFITALGIYFFIPNVPIYVPLITFLFMIVAVLFSATVTVTADSISKTLTFTKKRIIGSSQVVYEYNDIFCFCQVITKTVNQKGETVTNNKYTIGLNSQRGSLDMSYMGRRLITITIPKSGMSVVSGFMGTTEEFTRMQLLATFIGAPLYVMGGDHDTLANIQADVPRYTEEIKKLPETIEQIKDAMAQGKKENDMIAREILGGKM